MAPYFPLTRCGGVPELRYYFSYSSSCNLDFDWPRPGPNVAMSCGLIGSSRKGALRADFKASMLHRLGLLICSISTMKSGRRDWGAINPCTLLSAVQSRLQGEATDVTLATELSSGNNSVLRLFRDCPPTLNWSPIGQFGRWRLPLR